jgi:hypothetical protein
MVKPKEQIYPLKLKGGGIREIYSQINILGINLVKQIDVEAESIWTDVPAEET